MERPRIKLDCIRVQTARMMEIYALLQGEFKKNTGLGLTAQTRAQLDHAIATIYANMRQLLEIRRRYRIPVWGDITTGVVGVDIDDMRLLHSVLSLIGPSGNR